MRARPLWVWLLIVAVVCAFAIVAAFGIVLAALGFANGTDAVEALAAILLLGGASGLVIALPLAVLAAAGAVAGANAMRSRRPRLEPLGALLGSLVTVAVLAWLTVGQRGGLLLVCVLAGGMLASVAMAATTLHYRRPLKR